MSSIEADFQGRCLHCGKQLGTSATCECRVIRSVVVPVMTYDPTAIAREAAEQIAMLSHASLETRQKMIADYQPIILAAAARIVRESGAVEALAHSPSYSVVKDGMAYCRQDDLLQWCAARDAALANLKKLEDKT